MKYKAILFDMDGVLIESEFLMRHSAIQALADYGITAKHEDFLEFTGMGEDKFVGGVAEKYGHTYTFDMKEKAYDYFGQQVKEMAEARRDARIALMDRLVRTKESYLQPWNLRNHSIFMQFFEDLRVYLENTPAAEQKLDFLDMRYLASQRFFWLR